jgi:1,4-dihydroxy-6-naphthoate synthase
MDESVIQKHIGLYVNDFTIDLGQVGREAIRLLFRMAKERMPFPDLQRDFFVVDEK